MANNSCFVYCYSAIHFPSLYKRSVTDTDHLDVEGVKQSLDKYGGVDERFFSLEVQQNYIINEKSPSSVYGWTILRSGDFDIQEDDGSSKNGRYVCVYPRELDDNEMGLSFQYTRSLYLLYNPNADAIMYVHLGDLEHLFWQQK